MKTILVAIGLLAVTASSFGQAIIDPQTMLMRRAFGGTAEHIPIVEQRELVQAVDSLREVDPNTHGKLDNALNDLVLKHNKVMQEAMSEINRQKGIESRDLINSYRATIIEVSEPESDQEPETVSVEAGKNAAGSLELEQASTVDVKLFPNPTRGNTNIKFTLQKPEKTTIRLHGMDGRAVRTILNKQRLDATAHQYEVDLSGLAQGTYHVVAIVGERIISRAVVKQ